MALRAAEGDVQAPHRDIVIVDRMNLHQVQVAQLLPL
jgi:hypothetical protein